MEPFAADNILSGGQNICTGSNRGALPRLQRCGGRGLAHSCVEVKFEHGCPFADIRAPAPPPALPLHPSPRSQVAQAHGESIARDRRAADKLNSCVAGLLSSSALADGLAAPKGYSRRRQTILL
jgi:hypothetical protein